MNPIERFMSKVAPTDENGCWNWTAYKSKDGYGVFHPPTKTVKAHRWVYEQLIGPIPTGLTIDHLCRNRGCVNPLHMEPVSQSENYRRGNGSTFRRALTECVRGHEFTEDNTGWHAGKRYCRQCKRDREAPAARRYRAARKAKTNA